VIKKDVVSLTGRQRMPKLRARYAARFVSIGLVVFLFVSASFQTGGAKIPRRGGTFRIRDFGGPFVVESDPATGINAFVTEQLYDGLVRLDKNLNVVPDLADYWVISEEGKLCTFYLRKGAKFHHGREVTAEDVKFSLERLVRKTSHSPYSQFFIAKVVGAQEFHEGRAKEITGFRVVDKHAFEIQWNGPYVSGLYLMSMSFCKILPRELIESHGRSFFQKPVGTGPFRFAYWLRSPRGDIVGIRLEKNTEYFGKPAYLDAVEFSPYFTVDNFIEGDVEAIPFLSDRLTRISCRVLSASSFDLFFLGLSCHRPPLDRTDVRRALALGIDRSKLAGVSSTFDSNSRPMNNFIPAKLPGFYPLDDGLGQDPLKARHLLDELGFSPERPFPSLVFYALLPRAGLQLRIFQELKEQLARLGIPLKLEYYKAADELRRSKGAFLVLTGWTMDFPDPENIIRPLFYSKSDLNVFGYSSELTDDLLAKAEVEQSWMKRIELFLRIEQKLGEELPAIPLFSIERRVAVQPYVRGLNLPPLGLSYLEAKDIWLDK